MSVDYSREALLKFLDYMSNKGLLNANTASARKAACNKVFGILDDLEARDLRVIDIESVMSRFSNLKGSEYTPDSLNVYQSRVKSALGDFINYTNNPLGFKSSTVSVQKKTTDRPRPQKQAIEDAVEVRPNTSHSTYIQPQAAVSIMPIPLRADLTVYIQGLPFDLTISEANRLANVIKALATTD